MPNASITARLNSAYTQNSALHEDEFVAALYSYAGELLRVTSGDQKGKEDNLQEAVLQVWRKLPMFDCSKSKFSTWAYSIIRNADIDQHRRDLRQSPPEFLSTEDIADSEPDKGLGVEALYRIEEALKRLPKKELELVKRIHAGDTVNEAAKELGIGRRTAFNRWQRALAILRGDLEAL